MSRTNARRVLGLTLATAGLALTATPANATVFNVDRTDDPALNTCEQGSCSLRGAVVAANAVAGADEIIVPPGTYTLTIARTSLPQFGGSFKGDLDVNDQMTIRPPNPGAAAATPGTVEIAADANQTLDRVIEVNSSLTLEDVRLGGGVAPVEADQTARGSGIRVNAGAGFLARRSTIVGNQNLPPNDIGEGGGIYNAGIVTLTDSTVTTNTATFGAGIYTAGDAAETTIQRSTLRSNDAGAGGGIAALNGASVILTESRLGRNRADSGGGGGALAQDDAELTLINSNVDHNVASAVGGGGLRALSAKVAVDNSTVTANSSTGGGGISIADPPGGVDGYIILRNSIVAGNLDPDDAIFTDCRDESVDSSVVSRGYNLIGYQLGCNITPEPGDQFGGGDGTGPPIIPVLTTEAFYGGPSFVLVNGLDPRSPAVDTGAPDEMCSDTDLRGVPRPKGEGCDTGAYELVFCEQKVVNRVGTPVDDSGPTMEPTLRGGDGMLGFDGDDRLSGGVGNDGLCGNGDDDRLNGQDGNDRLSGGPGEDVCVGGPGNDTAKGCEVERSIP